MGELATQITAIVALLAAISGLLGWRRAGRNTDADTRLKNAQAEVAVSADARAWVEQYAQQAAEALEAAKECREEVRALRAYLVEVEAWARRNARPDAEPMPRLVWPLPMPQIRPSD